MRHWIFFNIIFFSLVLVVILTPVNAAEMAKSAKVTPNAQNYSLKKDIAFISVMGSRPDAKSLKGFQKAVLFNARGAKVKEITFTKSDSIYSLDRMLQENLSKGPLVIRMYR
jgi:uncharacterized alpha/beta hydrolase family protein